MKAPQVGILFLYRFPSLLFSPFSPLTRLFPLSSRLVSKPKPGAADPSSSKKPEKKEEERGEKASSDGPKGKSKDTSSVPSDKAKGKAEDSGGASRPKTADASLGAGKGAGGKADVDSKGKSGGVGGAASKDEKDKKASAKVAAEEENPEVALKRVEKVIHLRIFPKVGRTIFPPAPVRFPMFLLRIPYCLDCLGAGCSQGPQQGAGKGAKASVPADTPALSFYVLRGGLLFSLRGDSRSLYVSLSFLFFCARPRRPA